MLVNVCWTRSRDGDCGDKKRAICVDPGVANICCIFLLPARWVRIDGHLIAAERSNCRREDQDSGEEYSRGL